MDIKNQLKVIIGVLIAKVLCYFAAMVIDNYILFFLIDKICYLSIIFYLYKFIKIDKQQKIFLIPIILIAFSCLYFTAIEFFPIRFNKENLTNQEIVFRQMIVFSPGLIQILASLVFYVQLIINKAEDYINSTIKLIGVACIVEYVILFLTGIPEVRSFPFIEEVVSFAYLLPLFSMIKLYVVELKMLNSKTATSV